MTLKALHTIGYEGSSIGDCLAALEAAGIGFSSSTRCGWLATCDTEYLHLKGLGDPKPGRIAAREGRYDDFRCNICSTPSL
jgi:hypothetical protein